MGSITNTFTSSIVNGLYSEDVTRNWVLSQASEGGGNPGFVSIGTSEEDIAFGDVTPRFIMIENLDATNFVKYGPKSGGSMVLLGRVSPGGMAPFELGAGVTLRMVADTAACNVRIRGYNA